MRVFNNHDWLYSPCIMAGVSSSISDFEITDNKSVFNFIEIWKFQEYHAIHK